MKLSIDLNADLGEGSGHDAELFELISSANIATGFHAGDSDTMHAAILAAKKQGVAVQEGDVLTDGRDLGEFLVQQRDAGVDLLEIGVQRGAGSFGSGGDNA